MAIIYNTKSRKLTINLNEGKHLHVFPQEQMHISDEDFLSDHMQAFISTGHISVIEPDQATKEAAETSRKDVLGKKTGKGKKGREKGNLK